MASELAITFEETNLNIESDELNFEVQLETTFSIDKTVPTSVFHENNGLRGIVRYLHDEKKHSLEEIAKLLNRHINTIRTSYSKSKKVEHYAGNLLPTSIFYNLPPLEAASQYLSKQGKKLTEIAELLGRNPKTIWTALDRVRKK